jgi:hypothetical protein
MMSSPQYQTITTSMMVLPAGDSIFSEQATTIRIEDEAGGPFLVIEQHPDQTPIDGSQQIRIDSQEWASIKEACDQMMTVCALLNEQERQRDTSIPIITREHHDTL